MIFIYDFNDLDLIIKQIAKRSKLSLFKNPFFECSKTITLHLKTKWNFPFTYRVFNIELSDTFQYGFETY